MERLPEDPARGTFDVVEIKARLQSARGKGAEASRLVLEHARANEHRTGSAAGLLEELKQPAAAEQLYRRLVPLSRSPEVGKLILAQFLARQKRVGEALDLCDKAWPKLAPEMVAQVSVLVLYAGPTEQRCARVARSVEGALEKQPESIALLLHLAAVRNFQGRFDDAGQLYRRALRLNERHALALNNLAFLLALQEGKAAEAQSLVARAIAVRGPVPGLLDTRGVVHLALGRTDQAVKDLQVAVAERPSAAGYFHLAQAHHRQNKLALAVAALEKAKGLGLEEKDLHPLERPAYRRLKDTLAFRE
jgi:tetratricopeptide (TPR) repeat protein